MALYLVRHAKAGSRSAWVGPDPDRPLTRAGREQAEALAAVLAEHPVCRILSSPYVRCIETVEPLAQKAGLSVETMLALAEDADPVIAVELLSVVPDHTVACTHGDLVPAIIESLASRGMSVEGEPDWRKGVTWVLERDGDEFVRCHAVPPPV
jgi:8-oxo-dGTP diphosphatase